MRYLAIDYGTKRTGLAICDENETIVSPLATISSERPAPPKRFAAARSRPTQSDEGQKELIKEIANIVEEKNVQAIVLGLPLNMDGSYGPQTQLVLKFAEQLKECISVPVYLQDERLSSFGAEEKLASLQSKKGKKSKKRLDAIAAAEILQAFLERKNS